MGRMTLLGVSKKMTHMRPDYLEMLMNADVNLESALTAQPAQHRCHSSELAHLGAAFTSTLKQQRRGRYLFCVRSSNGKEGFDRATETTEAFQNSKAHKTSWQ